MYILKIEGLGWNLKISAESSRKHIGKYKPLHLLRIPCSKPISFDRNWSDLRWYHQNMSIFSMDLWPILYFWVFRVGKSSECIDFFRTGWYIHHGKCPLFLELCSPSTSFFCQSKQGSFVGSRCIWFSNMDMIWLLTIMFYHGFSNKKRHFFGTTLIHSADV